MGEPYQRRARQLTAIALVALMPALGSAQAPSARRDSLSADNAAVLRIFLDCDATSTPGCDFDFLRTELAWLHYTRDRADADVQIIVSSLISGSGGNEVVLRFVGLRTFDGINDEIRFNTPLNATTDDARRALARVIALGLARYAVRTPDGTNFALQYRGKTAAAGARPVRDRWNHWLFSIGADGWTYGESRSSSTTLQGTVTARRITERWKLESRAYADRTQSSYTLSDSSQLKTEVRTYEGSAVLVRSLGQHVSIGASLKALSYTVENIDLATTVAPTLEFDFFPYREFANRRLVLSYSVGLNHFDYTDTTLFDQVREVRADQVLWLGFSTRQPWGNMDLGVAASSFVPDVQKNKVKVSSTLTFRVARGLQVTAGGSYSRVRDQINLPKDAATDEELLLQLRSLRTDYRYSAQLGLQYTFGSVFNNVVNPRMSSNGR